MSLDRIPLAGVIGSPIAHSKSPILHGHWLKSLQLPGHYVHLDIASNKLEEALRFMPNLGFVGANVTLPYKERALEIADSVSDRATIIGAANTLIFHPDGRILADNTDGYGFLENMRQSAPDCPLRTDRRWCSGLAELRARLSPAFWRPAHHNCFLRTAPNNAPNACVKNLGTGLRSLIGRLRTQSCLMQLRL